MPLGLLVKDSIQDLEALGREAEHQENELRSKRKAQPEVVVDPEILSSTTNEFTNEFVANPQQAEEYDSATLPSRREISPTSSDVSSYGRYTGFQADYAAFQDETTSSMDSYYYHDSYAPVFLAEKTERKSFLECIFPCWRPQQTNFEFEQQSIEDTQQRSGPREEDEVSTNSEAFGEKLSEKERQAVLARLGLAQPDAPDTADIHTATNTAATPVEMAKKGLLNGIPTYDMSPLNQPPDAPPVKGILKRWSQTSNLSTALSASLVTVEGVSKTPPRRSLFPAYEPSMPKKNVNVSFAPMARVVTVKSKNDMDLQEKGDIWFQKSDYEDFRRTGRIITKAMVEGGSEIWLANSDKAGKSSVSSVGDQGDKWWHKFGHSRRGLEHVVSIEEGRERQANVRNAIHAVLEEQTRQKRYRREDPDKLRTVSLVNTSWARDLALASGSSDADAVKCSFARDRKSREFFLLKMARSSPSINNNRRVPEFMQPIMQASTVPTSPGMTAIKQQQLDANTAVQIRFRHELAQKDTMPMQPSRAIENSEPIKDPETGHRRTESMAQRAKGFSAEGAEKVDMAAVLSGMGALPQELPIST